MTRATKLLVLAALLSAPVVALATGPGPVPGFNAAATPLVKVNATTVGIRASSSTQSGYMSAVQASDLVYALANLGGGGGGSGATVSSSITGAQSQCTTFYPIDNTPPLVSEGCQIATVNVTPLSIGERIVVQGHAIVGNSGASHNACWLTQDADPAHATTSQFMSASDVGDVDMTVIWVTSAATTSARSYSIYCASDSSNGRTLYINAAYTGNAEFGGTYSSGVWVTEYAAGGGGIPDPYTGNGWTPASGTGTLTGNYHVTGSLTKGGVDAMVALPFSAKAQAWSASPSVAGQALDADAGFSLTGASASTDGCVLIDAAVTNVYSYTCRVYNANLAIVTSTCVAAGGCVGVPQQSTFSGYVVRL